MACYLTADGGTESLRVRLYDLEGNCLGQKAVPYETRFSPSARAEQTPRIGGARPHRGHPRRSPRSHALVAPYNTNRPGTRLVPNLPKS